MGNDEAHKKSPPQNLWDELQNAFTRGTTHFDGKPPALSKAQQPGCLNAANECA